MIPSFVPLAFERLSLEESRARVTALRDLLRRRRSVREIAPDPVPADLIDAAPLLIVVFAIDWVPETGPGGRERRHKNYYVQESVGIAVGLLLAALHAAGLVTLTHTPSPMGFLGQLLDRPRNERAYVLLPVGYPAPGASVPDIQKKSLEEIRTLV